jgi:hypothetical protein
VGKIEEKGNYDYLDVSGWIIKMGVGAMARTRAAAV